MTLEEGPAVISALGPGWWTAIFLIACAAVISRLFMIRISWRIFWQSRIPSRELTARLAEARAAEPLTVTWLGHATSLIQIGSRFILLDPLLFDHIGRLQRRLVQAGMDPQNLPPIDLTAVTHGHLDHLDWPSLKAIRGGGGLVVPRGLAKYMPAKPPYSTIVELRNYQSYESAGIKITAVPAKHWGGRYGVDGLWARAYCGFVLEADGFTIYYAGDSGPQEPMFREIGRRWKIDVAILPLGPEQPRWIMRINHMNGKKVLHAFETLGAAHLIPVHHSTIIQSYDPLGEPRRSFSEMIKSRPDADAIHLLFFGQQASFDRRGGRLVHTGVRGPETDW